MTSNRAPSLDTFKGIYRGWFIAAISALSIGAVLGTAQYTFSMFILPLEETFGWSRTQVNGALTFGVVSSLLSPYIGKLMDRIGAKWTMAGSIMLVAIAFLLRSVMTELWHFYLFSVVMFAGLPGATMMPAGRLVNLWFPRIRGRMMGIVTAGNNFGSMIAIPIVAGLITLTGWRGTFAIMTFFLLGIAMLVLVVIRDGDDDVEQEKHKRRFFSKSESQKILNTKEGFTTSEAIRTSVFWFLAVGMMLQQFLRTCVISQMVPHLQQVGFSLAEASGAMMLLALFGTISKLVFGRLSETITARLAFVVILILQSVGLAILVASGGSVAAWGGIVVTGLGMGGVGALTPLVIADTFGLRQFGSIMGMIRMPVIIPVIAGPIMAGMIFDATESYHLVFLTTIVMLVISVGAFLLARSPSQKVLLVSSN